MLLWLLAVQPTAFDMELPVSPETPAGQRMVAIRAIELCAGRYPVLGHYRFDVNETVEGTAAPSRFHIRQELECRDTPPTPRAPAGEPLPANWQASEADQRRATEATRAYFAAVDAGDVARLEAMMTPGHRADQTTADRTQQLAAFRERAGRPSAHRIIRVSWYVNPPGVEPGAYAAVDFDRTYARLAISCGYVAWHRQPDGRLLLVREETGSAPRTPDLTPDQIARFRVQLQCRD